MMQFGLIGYPLGHSLSPKIHIAALVSCGIEGDYSLFPIHPDDWQRLKDLLSRVRNGELTGLNVTIPHKQNIIALLDDLSPTAKAIGAVNTLSMRNGNLTGDNTDAPGFILDVKRFLNNRQSAGENQKSALILGAGGSARAVVYALINDGWDVVVAARRIEQAEELANLYAINTMILDDLQSSTFDLLVNTTPLGMSPNQAKSPWPTDLSFPSNAAVYDLVYNPRETQLICDARAAGLPATTGLGMLIEQAALAFEIWTGESVPRKPLFASVEEL